MRRAGQRKFPRRGAHRRELEVHQPTPRTPAFRRDTWQIMD
jgi:hypothetical protein